jgi:hypothetical protein
MYPERQNRILTYFVEGLHTLDTNMQPLRLTVDHHRALKHVGAELTIGVPLGETDIVSVLRAFATDFTLSHPNHLFAK